VRHPWLDRAIEWCFTKLETGFDEDALDRLERDQQDDGGWQITWEPPGVVATLEWRGIETLRALRVLRAYGRI
jgi:hypothetical protein